MSPRTLQTPVAKILGIAAGLAWIVAPLSAQHYSVAPASLSTAAGTDSGSALLHLDLPDPFAGASPTTLSFTAEIPSAVSGKIALLPDPISITLQPGSTQADSQRFHFAVSADTPPGLYTVPLVTVPPQSGTATLVPASTLVARINLQVTAPAPTPPPPPPSPRPGRMRLIPPRLTIEPGQTSAPVTLQLSFPTPVSGAGRPETIQVTVPPELEGRVQVDPFPLTYTLDRRAARSARTTFRIVAHSDAPLGRWRLRFVNQSFAPSAADLTLRLQGPRAPAPDLGVRIEPSSLSLCAGGTARPELVLEPQAGYRGAPRISWRRLPAGLKLSPPMPGTRVPPTRRLPLSLSAAPGSSGPSTVTVEVRDAAHHVRKSVTLRVTTISPDLTPRVSPRPIQLPQGAAPRSFRLWIEPNQCLAPAPVRVLLSGGPEDLYVQPPSGPLTGPDWGPVDFALKALPGLALGTYHLTATFTAPGLPAKQLDLPVEVVPPGPQELLAAPSIDLVSPSRLRRGEEYLLSFRGRNLRPGTTVSFGSDLQVLAPPLFTSEYAGTVRVMVPPAAQLGVHAAVAENSQGKSEGPGGVLVTTATGPPEIVSVEPPLLEPGKSYLLKLAGTNLTAETQVSFGEGVEIEGPLAPQEPGILVAKVKVAPEAPTGSHLAVATGPGGTSQGPGAVAVGVSGPALAVAPTVPSPFVLPVKGFIYLQSPEWGSKDLSTFQAGYTQELGVPALTDELKFGWREANPGTADTFELRLLDRTGSTVLLRRSILPGVTIAGVTYPFLPTFYRPDAAFLAEVAALLQPASSAVQHLPGAAATSGAIGASFPAAASGPAGSPIGSAPEPSQLDAAGPRDLLWEVAGFQLPASAPGQPSSGGSGPISVGAGPPPSAHGASPAAPAPQSSPAAAVEVEISERWPLRLAGRPTGLGCPAGGRAQGQISFQNVESPDQNTYVQDLLELQGSFSLADSPWAAHPQPVPSPTSGWGNGQQTGPQFKFADTFQFDNVFVDWGDGTVEALRLQTQTSLLYWTPDQPLSLQAGADAPSHRYAAAGSYVVRIYQLASGDLQTTDPQTLAFTQDGLQGQALALVQLAGWGPADLSGEPAAAGFSAAASGAAAGRAYMVYCRRVEVLPRTDPCARGRLRLASIEIIGFPGHDVIGSSPGTGAEGLATDCDEAMAARARLSFFGRGQAVVRFRWEDGTVFYTSPVLDLASRPRTDLGADPTQWGPPVLSTVDIDAPLTVDLLGVHGVSAEAEVLFDPLTPLLFSFLGGNGGQGTSWCPGVDSETSAVFFPFDFPFDDQGATGDTTAEVPADDAFQVGVLLPAAWAANPSPGTPHETPLPPTAVAPLGAVLPGSGGAPGPATSALGIQPAPSGRKEKPDWVESPVKHYEVIVADPSRPCFFLFPTQQGTFRVTDVNQSVQAIGGGRFSGQGLLAFPLSAGPDSFKETPIPVQFTQWLAPDGLTVQEGSLDVAPSLDLGAPGVRARLDRVAGSAGNAMLATFDLRPVQQSLVQPAGGWKAEEPITSDGNWISLGRELASSPIGYSGFSLAADDVALDLSRAAGPSPSASFCGASGPSWVGIHLGKATVVLPDFGIGAGLDRPLDGWTIGSAGLCGQATLAGIPETSWGDGWLASDAVVAVALAGGFHATYQNFRLFSPWFGAPLGGVDVELFDSGGTQQGFSLPGLGDAPPQDWGTVGMEATDLVLERQEGIGWAIGGSTRFRFTALDGTFFAQIDTDRLHFGLADSRVSIDSGKSAAQLGLQGVAQPQAPHLGAAPVDLLSVDLQASLQGAERLRFGFSTQPSLSSSAALTAQPMGVGYAITRQPAGLAANGPATDPFEATIAFPLGNPTITATVAPAYHPGSTYFCGNLNLGLLGGKGMTAGTSTFVLGYDGSGHDGWLAHYRVPLAGGSGIPIAPPLPIQLFSIEGGIAYNLAAKGTDPKKGENPFADPLTCQTPFTITDGGMLFAAGLEAGTTDHTTVAVRGVLSASDAFGTRFDVDGWLLRSDHSGPGDIEGLLQWNNGSFTGKFWGGYEFLEDPFFGSGAHAVDLDLGSGPGDAAVDLLFDKSGAWHVHAGDKYGTPISGRVLFAKSQAWLMLDGTGLSSLQLQAGGRQELSVGGCVWKCCAKAYAKFECGLELGYNPARIGGSAKAEFGVKICGVGLSLGATVKLGCCAPYADVKLCADIKPCIKCGDFACWPSLCEACAGFSL